MNEQMEMIIVALKTIAEKSVNCSGPGCPYCELENEHPVSWESRIAREALEKAGIK